MNLLALRLLFDTLRLHCFTKVLIHQDAAQVGRGAISCLRPRPTGENAKERVLNQVLRLDPTNCESVPIGSLRFNNLTGLA